MLSGVRDRRWQVSIPLSDCSTMLVLGRDEALGCFLA